MFFKKQTKAKQFHYEPLYYDEIKERIRHKELELKKEQHLAEKDNVRSLNRGYAGRISDGFRSARSQQKSEGLNLTVVAIVLILCATVYLYAYVGSFSLFALVGIYVVYKVKQRQLNRRQE